MITTAIAPLAARVLKRAATLFLGAALASTLALGLYYFSEQSRIHAEIAQREILSVRHAGESIATKLQALGTDFKVLAQLPELAAYLQTPGAKSLTGLGEALRVFSSAKRSYDQLRFLDVQGMEIARVNYGRGGATIVPAAQLQSKADRPYFKNAVVLQPGAHTSSPLDLNMEKGKIEEPFKPMLRLSGPVHDAGGQLRGALVLNYLAENVLDDLKASLNVAPGAMMLLNSEGFWLKGISPDDEWGFMLPQRKERTFAARWPETWGRMAHAHSGQMLTDEGLFTFETVNPFGLSQDAATLSAPSWKLVSWISPETHQQSTRSLRMAVLLAQGLLLAIVAPGCVALAWASTKRTVAEQTLREREKLYRTLVENFPNGAVMLLQPDMNCVLAEGKGLKLMGFDKGRVEGQRLPDAFPPEVRGTIEEHVAKALQGEEIAFEVSFNEECYQAHIVPVYHDQGQLMAEMFMVQNISERKKLENALLDAATVDPLTGLPNRRRFSEQLDILIGLATRYAQPLCLCMCDIDHFKQVNDTYGHAAGDMTLARFGAMAQGLLRDTDLVARLGGDEFGILLPQTQSAVAVHVLERFRARLITEEIDAGPLGRFSITSSLGVAQFRPGMTAEAFMEEADKALYTAKRGGRNRVST